MTESHLLCRLPLTFDHVERAWSKLQQRLFGYAPARLGDWDPIQDLQVFKHSWALRGFGR